MAKKQFNMSDGQKAKYAELFIYAIDNMEACNYTMPWVAPRHGEPMNYEHKKPYKGMNNFFLTLLCAMKGWQVPMFLTFEQVQKMGLTLNVATDKDGMPKFKDNGMPRFEQPWPIVKKLTSVYKDREKITFDEYDQLTDEEKDECRWKSTLRSYNEFNISQTNFKEVCPEKWEELTRIPPHEYQEGTVDKVLNEMIEGGQWRCPIEFTGHEACYSPSKDRIRLPKREQFLGDHAFYATALHEMAHSTAPDVDREIKGTFGSEAYAKEEFVAEMTAASVCSMLGIGKLLDKNHVAYIQNWRQAIKTDKDFIPRVIDYVQEATNFILRKYKEVAKQSKQPLALPKAA